METTVHVLRKMHRGESRIFIYTPNTPEMRSMIKSLNGAKWSSTHRAWHIEDNNYATYRIIEVFKGKAWVDFTELNRERNFERAVYERHRPPAILNDIAQRELDRYKEYLHAKRYSKNTRETYFYMVKTFFGYYSDMDPTDITNEDLNAFMQDYVVARRYSVPYQRQMTSALKSYYLTRQDRAIELDKIPSIKKERRLPKVLSKKEVEGLLNATTNLKHKAILSVMYGCGLRVGEVIELRLEDILGKQHRLFVRNGKGRKDRSVNISDKILHLLRSYYRQYKPRSGYLFESPQGRRYSAASINKFIKRSAAKAGINRNITCHMLRHSYATHLLESGVDLRYIQELLGHGSSKTTEIYTYVSNEKLESVKSPFDDLDVSESWEPYNRLEKHNFTKIKNQPKVNLSPPF